MNYWPTNVEDDYNLLRFKLKQKKQKFWLLKANQDVINNPLAADRRWQSNFGFNLPQLNVMSKIELLKCKVVNQQTKDQKNEK